MEFSLPKRQSPTINLSALIDISFILVIFVVLAANFQRINNVSVKLPSAVNTDKAPPEAVTIAITAAGTITINDEPVSSTELGNKLKILRKQNDAVLIIADRESVVDKAVEVLNQAQLAGFSSVGFAANEKASK